MIAEKARQSRLIPMDPTAKEICSESVPALRKVAGAPLLEQAVWEIQIQMDFHARTTNAQEKLWMAVQAA